MESDDAAELHHDGHDRHDGHRSPAPRSSPSTPGPLRGGGRRHLEGGPLLRPLDLGRPTTPTTTSASTTATTCGASRPPSQVKRAAKLTVNATPEPVKKGKHPHRQGRADPRRLDTSKYAGYTGQPVALQFKAKGATAYKTVKTVTSGTAGALRPRSRPRPTARTATPSRARPPRAPPRPRATTST